MVDRVEIYQRLMTVFGLLLIPHNALASGDVVIRGDQPTSIISHVPVEPKLPPVWLTEGTGPTADDQLRQLFAELELFTQPPSGDELKSPDAVTKAAAASENELKNGVQK